MRPAPRHPYLDWSGPLAFAHRGGTGIHPENTVAAFDDAVELGFTYLETDVHATSDGVLVAFHDPDLARTCGRPGTISALPWREVAEARVGGEHPIPTLDELLERYPGARFNIDCKADSAVAPLASALRRHDCLDRVAIGSFNELRLRRLRRELGSGLCTSLGPAGVTALVTGAPLPTAAHAAQVPVSQGPIPVVTDSFIRRAHRRGLQVHVWTIDDPTEIGRLLDLGVDGIMSDDLRALRDVLESRRLWL